MHCMPRYTNVTKLLGPHIYQISHGLCTLGLATTGLCQRLKSFHTRMHYCISHQFQQMEPTRVRYATAKKQPVSKWGEARRGFMDTEVWDALKYFIFHADHIYDILTIHGLSPLGYSMLNSCQTYFLQKSHLSNGMWYLILRLRKKHVPHRPHL